MLEGADLRTQGDIRSNALEFQEAKELHQLTHKTKLSSARWYNCERLPLDSDIPDGCTVLSVYPPEVLSFLLLLLPYFFYNLQIVQSCFINRNYI